jgi:hypothetical protein
MYYSDSDIQGIDETSLRIHRLNGSSWNEAENCIVYAQENRVRCTTSTFSTYALFGSDELVATPTTTPTLTPTPTIAQVIASNPTSTPVPTATQTSSNSGSSSSTTVPTATPTISSQSSSSSNSSSTTATTAETICRSLPPLNAPVLTQIITKNNSATLTFAPPSGEYTRFEIYYGYTQNDTQFTQRSSRSNEYTVSNLKPNTNYFFSIKAFNDCAGGTVSNRLAATTTRFFWQSSWFYKTKPGTKRAQPSATPTIVPPFASVDAQVTQVSDDVEIKPSVSTNAAVEVEKNQETEEPEADEEKSLISKIIDFIMNILSFFYRKNK